MHQLNLGIMKKLIKCLYHWMLHQDNAQDLLQRLDTGLSEFPQFPGVSRAVCFARIYNAETKSFGKCTAKDMGDYFTQLVSALAALGTDALPAMRIFSLFSQLFRISFCKVFSDGMLSEMELLFRETDEALCAFRCPEVGWTHILKSHMYFVHVRKGEGGRVEGETCSLYPS